MLKYYDLRFVMATHNDVDEIMNLYKEMLGSEGCTWSAHYPNVELLKRDIESNNEFCFKDRKGKIVAAIVIEEDEEVKKLQLWNRDYKKAGELARLAVKTQYQNHGLAVKLIQCTAKVLKQRDYDAICFLVSKNNLAALASYKKLNLNLAGEVNLYGEDWICYEGRINEDLFEKY